MSEDSEWEEEETLVFMELSGILESDFKNKTNTDFKVLGLGTDAPMLQFDNYTFSGHYEDTLGTCLLFEDKGPTEEKTELTDSEIFQKMLRGSNKPATKKVEFSGYVSKKLCMTRAFLSKDLEDSDSKTKVDTEKTQDQTDTSQEDSQTKHYGMIPLSYGDHDELLTASYGDSLSTEPHSSENSSNIQNVIDSSVKPQHETQQQNIQIPDG